MNFERPKSQKYCPKSLKPLFLASLWFGLLGLTSLEAHTPARASEIAIAETAASEAPPAAEAAPEAAPAPEASAYSAPAALAPAELPAPAAPEPAQDYYSAPPVAAPAREPSRPLAQSRPDPDPYIDTKDYSIGATQPYTPPESIIVRERSSGCQATLAAGQGVAGLCGVPPAQQLSAVPSRSAEPPAWASVPQSWDRSPERWGSSSGTSSIPQSYGQPGLQSAQNAASANSPYTVALPRNFSLKPITGANPLKWILPDGEHMIFPLPIPVDITSVFGWRIHPITGQWSFHSGTDLGAPMGTPVLAAYSGRVSLAEFMGGYGLSILLDHSQGSHETRYAHLSQVFVKPGQWVQQGTVIGLVGSTGNSTGPHLHFEALESVQGSLVAVDPGLELQTTLSQLADALKTARLTAQTAPKQIPQVTQAKSTVALSPDQGQ